MFQINKNLSVPVHKQIEDELRKLIIQSEYVKGKVLPPETQLAKELGVARATIRHAINSLVVEGLLVRKKGFGTTVKHDRISGYGRKWKSFTQEMTGLGIQIKNYELHISWEPANHELAKLFNIEINSRVLKLVRLRGSQEGPFVYFISYFNPVLPLTGEENYNNPLYSLLKEHCSCIVKTSTESIIAINATKELASKLEVMPGIALLQRNRKVYDENKLLVEYNIGYYRSDKYTYHILFE